MPDPISLEQLVNAGEDARDLADIVNGSATINGTGLVPTRYGGDRKSLARLEDEYQTIIDSQAVQEEAASAALSIIQAIYDKPIYANTTLGLAGTVNNEEFAVDNGDDTATIYLNSSGSAVEQRVIILDPRAAGSAALIGSNDGASGSLWTTVAGFITYLRSTAGASIAGFIQSGANAVAETLQIAVRREVWADQYKLPGDADDGPCITRAVTAMLAAGGGGVVRLSRRAYTLNSGISFSGLNNVRIVGAGKNSSGTMIRETFTNGDAVTFSNCQHCEISGVTFWPTVRKTGGFSVKLTGGSFACFVDIRTEFGWNGLLIEGATETRWKLVSRYMLGVLGTLYTGQASSRSFRAICEDQISDNPYPIAPTPSSIKTFSGGMTLTAGDIFTANGAIWQCTVGGTAAGTAPSGYPAGTTPESVFFTDVACGSATLRFISNSALTHLLMDNYAYSLVINKAALLNGARAFVMEDTASTGSSYPIWVDATNLECDHAFTVGVDLVKGEGFYGHGFCWVGSTLAGNGVVIGPNHRGNVVLGPGTRVYGNAHSGVLRQAGPIDVRLIGVEAADNGVAASNTYHGLNIAASANRTQVIGGYYGDSPSVASNAQAYGIYLANGTTDTQLIGAHLLGNVTAAINVGTGHTRLQIADCVGYNNGSASALTVGASPWTYENTTGARVSLTISGGTVSSVTLGGDQIANATGTQVLVPIGGSVVITYSSLPTVKAQLL